jgi:1-acyl-sn-glycerol-3-phosphate acyltransferase
MVENALENFYAFPRIALVQIYRLITRVKTYNLSRIPDNSTVLLAVNHTSGIDPIILLVGLKRKIYFIADSDNFKNRFSVFFMRKVANSIPLYQDQLRKNPSTLKEMINIKNRGKTLFGYFPEGRRHSVKGFGKMHKGAAYFSYKLDIPLLPVYIHNHLKGPPRESLLGKVRALEGLIAITINIFRKINIFVGEPIYPERIEPEKSKYKNRELRSKSFREEIDRIFVLMVEQFIYLKSQAE